MVRTTLVATPAITAVPVACADDGSYVAGPLYGEETIVYREIDLRRVAAAKREVDVAGHYSRPDVVRLLFDETPHRPLVAAGKPDHPQQLYENGQAVVKRPAKKTRSRKT